MNRLMPRRAISALVGAVVSFGACTGQADERRPRVIGYLHSQSAGAGSSALEIIENELARLGYVEGRTVVYERRYAEGSAKKLGELAADLVGRNVDLIIAQTTSGALAAKRLSSTIPIIFTSSGDAVGSGLVESLARPGGNATGNSFLGTELAIKLLELVRELVPAAKTVALVGNASLPPEPLFFEKMRAPGRALGLEVVFVDVRSSLDFERAADDLRARGVDGAIWANGGYTDRKEDRVKLVAATARLPIPSIYFRRELVDDGGLIAYGPHFPELYRQAAGYAHRILSGENPADLPVQQPSSFELILNLRTAKAQGFTVPPLLLVRADEVIE